MFWFGQDRSVRRTRQCSSLSAEHGAVAQRWSRCFPAIYRQEGPGDRARTFSGNGENDHAGGLFHHAKLADRSICRPMALLIAPSCRSILIQQPRHVSGGCADELKTSMDEIRKWPADINFVVCGTRRWPPGRHHVIERQPLHELSFRFSARAAALALFRKLEQRLEGSRAPTA